MVAILCFAVSILACLCPIYGAPSPNARLDGLVAKVLPQVVEWRRDFHCYPELSNREERTGRVVAERLEALGVDGIRRGVAGHGVVALIRGGRPGPVVALRADMDALPVAEATGLPYASKNSGVMHACGHDAHTAMLLGAAAVLVGIRGELSGSVKLLFQPAEEGSPPGEEGGARLMIAEKALENPKVEAIFGLHVHPEIDCGKVASRAGSLMASVDRFRIEVIGKQSHGAMPWQGIDPIVAAAQVVSALQTIASRRIDARQPIVVSIGIVQGGQAWNIIPGKVTLEGTIRTHDASVRRLAREEFQRIVVETTAAAGATAEIEFSDYGPAVLNDIALYDRMQPLLARSLGRASVIEAEPMMGGEDFALYGEVVPSLFLFLGVRDPAAKAPLSLHTPTFTIDERALPIGVKTLVTLATEYLRQPLSRTAAGR